MKNICRICFKEELLTDIFMKTGPVMLSLKLMSIAKINVKPDDGLPNTICLKCVQKLNDCLEFIRLCESSDVKLRRLLTSNCKEDKINNVSMNCLINDKYFSDSSDSMSPKSETDKMLFIDESIDHSIIDQTIFPVHIEDTKILTKDRKKSKKNCDKSEKQQCFTCGKVMSSRFRLKTHMRTHTGERPFSCPHCNKNFSLAQNLKVHLRVHTGEKPLHCSVCGESFAHSAGLAAHRRKHTGQMPYKCSLCPRAFRTVGHLQYHTRRHTGEKNFECDTCGRAFINRSDLKQHLMTHTGARPHVCCICGLRLRRASHLKRHALLMHADKDLNCSQCPAKFTKKEDLQNHVRTHDGTEDIDKT